MASAAPMSQLNVRINSEVKAAGDSTLELAGVSSTELIRTIWQKLALGTEAFAQIARALAADPAAGSVKRVSDAHGTSCIVGQIQQRQTAFEREVELDLSACTPIGDEELDELVYQDYLEKWEANHVG